MTQHQATRQKNDCIIIPPSIPVVASSGKRKRRLSDAGYDGTPKRPHNALAVPRLQTVSDPFPLANPIISELHKTPFNQTISDSIPSPVSVESLDPFPLINPIISELHKTPFNQTISDNIPSPVSVESLDDTQVEIDFYNFDTSPEIIQSYLFPDSLDPFSGKFSFN